jgi:NAD(P)-dependent dehydrogenase (short-subunit alcohol dehydrogenase family)
MNQRNGDNKSILITGGTSGLGQELVRIFLAGGYDVIATGRQKNEISGFPGRYFLYLIDFGDLRQVAETTYEICRNHSVNMLINNAGILSPPSYRETSDGLEYTFQINFLAHLLIDEIILKSRKDERPLIIASVTSPVYKLAGNKPGISKEAGEYSAISSYSSSKLLLAMMPEFLDAETNMPYFHCFSYDPGTFRSSIYRTQNSWFRKMYRIAAPFMKSPSNIAAALSDLLLNGMPENGLIYDISKRKREVPAVDKSHKEALIQRCQELIDPYLRQPGL